MMDAHRYSALHMRKMSMGIRACLEILYPPECPVCQKLLINHREKDMGIHAACCRRLKRIQEPMCKKCGKPLVSPQQEYCYDCSRRPGSFESGHGLWLYDRCSSDSIFAYKYGRKREYAAFYTKALLHFYGAWIRDRRVQQLVPVPVSRQKKRQRGFNQAQLLAEGIGETLHIPVNSKGLVRIHSTAPQKELGKEERRKNLEKAFQADAARFRGVKRVLLIDDIYTTGSTVEYCTRALQKAGVEKVWFLTLCIGGPF